jgi:hypothetical protein
MGGKTKARMGLDSNLTTAQKITSSPKRKSRPNGTRMIGSARKCRSALIRSCGPLNAWKGSRSGGGNAGLSPDGSVQGGTQRWLRGSRTLTLTKRSSTTV